MADQVDPFSRVMGGITRGTAKPPASSSPAVQSLAEFKRRLRTGAMVQYERLDERGDAVATVQGTIRRDEPAQPYFFVRTEAGKEVGVYLPERARDCEFRGPSVSWPGARVWLLDESQVGPLPEPKPKKKRLPPLDPDWQEPITAVLAASLGLPEWETRWRYWSSPVPRGPIFGWTTSKSETGEWLSWVAVPVGRGTRSGEARRYRVDQDSFSWHDKKNEAKERALRLRQEFESDGGKPWV